LTGKVSQHATLKKILMEEREYRKMLEIYSGDRIKAVAGSELGGEMSRECGAGC
jgi:hypothetical protein